MSSSSGGGTGTSGEQPPTQTASQQSQGEGSSGGSSGNDVGNRGTSRGSGSSRKHGRNQGNNTSSVDEELKVWKGACENIGGVLGMTSEVIDAKVPFDTFRDKLENYVMRTFDNGSDVIGIITELKDPADDFEARYMPKDIDEEELKKSAVKRTIHDQRCKAYVLREDKMVAAKSKIFGLIWGQCSVGLQAVIRHMDEYNTKKEGQDVIWLLKQVKVSTSGLDEKTNKFLQYHQAILRFWNMRQKPEESTDAYFKRYNSLLQTLEFAGGSHIFYSDDLVDKDIQVGENPNRNPTKKEKEACEERVKAMCLMQRSDPNRFAPLLEELKNSSFLGKDDYPKTAAEAYALLLRRASPVPSGNRGGGGRHGVQFVQAYGNDGAGNNPRRNNSNDDLELVAGRDGSKVYKRCYNCNRMGHVRAQCPESRSGTSVLQFRYNFLQSGGAGTDGTRDKVVNKNWILLDTCSTASVGNNQALVHNIHACPPEEQLTLVGQGGEETFTDFATLNLLPIKMHFNADSLATIIAMKDVCALSGCHVTMDSREEKAIKVHFQGQVYKFKECNEGLYYLDTAGTDVTSTVNQVCDDAVDEDMDSNSKNSVTDYSLIQSVKKNQQYFTNQEIEAALHARKIQQQIGWPSTQAFKSIVAGNLITNCTVTVDDITRSEHIYGPPEPLLKGKMTRAAPPQVKIEKIPIPAPILEFHKNVTLLVDIFYVNGLMFLHTKSEKLNFLTVELIDTKDTDNIKGGLLDVMHQYGARQLQIGDIRGDNEFEVAELRKALLPAKLHICEKGAHVGGIERSIRHVKERARCTCHAVPYKRYTKLMTKALVEGVIYWLNNFPSKNGISQTMSPASIVLGRPKPDFNHKRITFGSYALAYHDTDNTMKRRAVPAIALKESNEHGGHYFMSLHTGKQIHSYRWKELPIDQEVEDRVDELAKKEGRKIMADKYPMFEWQPGVPILDGVPEEGEVQGPMGNNENNEEVDNNNDAVDEANDDQDVNQGANAVVSNDDDLSENNEDDPHNIVGSNELSDSDLSFGDETEYNTTNDVIGDDIAENPRNEELDNKLTEESTNTPSDEENNDNTHEPAPQSLAEPIATSRPRRANAGAGVDRLDVSVTGKYYTSRRKHLNFLMKHKQNDPAHVTSYFSAAVNACFTQMSARAGFKKFGQRAIAAMFKEFQQLDKGAAPGKPVFGVIDPDKLTLQQKLSALEAVNLIKEKRCGKIKGRTCANGSKQHKYLKEGETIASPTISTEALLTSYAIDAFEERDVAIFDVPGAYLHASFPKGKYVLLKLRDEFVDIMCEVNPAYKPFVRNEKGKKVLYLRILQALYGCIESALLWYQLYSSTLERMGFKINPYDRCVANKEIEGSQCTICWYVDDNKLSHKSEKVVTDVLEEIKQHFGDLVIARGRKHDFLGMDIEFIKENRVTIHMKKALEEAIEAFPEKIESTAVTPAANHLFITNNECTKLDEKRSDIFHSIVAKLLYIMKRARPDLETAVAFLCTRVSKSDEDDWKKLKRVLKYVYGTLDYKRVIGAKSLKDLQAWIDAAYAVHWDMRSHTGGAMSFGIGTIHCKSSRQKLNTKSSTEAELVGMSDYLPYNLWMRMFMKEQGYELSSNVIYQDNQSAMLMEQNGRNSCTGNSRHVDIRYFFVKDRINNKEVMVKYCPTYIMLADFFTKALQGSTFKLLRDVIMGHMTVDEFFEKSPSIKERVGKRFRRMLVSEADEEKSQSPSEPISGEPSVAPTGTKEEIKELERRKKMDKEKKTYAEAVRGDTRMIGNVKRVSFYK